MADSQGVHVNAQAVVNWEAVIDDLRRQGLTMHKIAQECEIDRTSLYFYRDGGQPKHPDGEKLITLWMGMTNHTRNQVPMIVPPLSAAAMR